LEASSASILRWQSTYPGRPFRSSYSHSLIYSGKVPRYLKMEAEPVSKTSFFYKKIFRW
jgi:hypothetical protein